MSTSQASGSNSWDTVAPNIFCGEAWDAILIGMAQRNAHAAEGMGAFFSEWQNFVSHRLTQDMHFMQRLASCRSPNEIAVVYGDFWWTAYADYARELTRISKLRPGVATKAVSNAHSASKEAAKAVSPPRVAA